MTGDWHILSAAVCNRCEDLYPKTDSIVLALHKGPEDGLRIPMSLHKLQEGDRVRCLICGSEYEVRKEWPRNLETGQPAITKEYARRSGWSEW